MQDILNAIKEQINGLADGDFSFTLYISVAGAAVLLAFILSLISSLICRKRQEKRYIENFKREFTGNIRTTLQAGANTQIIPYSAQTKQGREEIYEILDGVLAAENPAQE